MAEQKHDCAPFKLVTVLLIEDVSTARDVIKEETDIIVPQAYEFRVGHFGVYRRAPRFEYVDDLDLLVIEQHCMISPLFSCTEDENDGDLMNVASESVVLRSAADAQLWDVDKWAFQGGIDYCMGKPRRHEEGVFCTHCYSLDINTPVLYDAIKKSIDVPFSETRLERAGAIKHGNMFIWIQHDNGVDFGSKAGSRDVIGIKRAISIIKDSIADSQITLNRLDLDRRKSEAIVAMQRDLEAKLKRIAEDCAAAKKEYDLIDKQGRSVEALNALLAKVETIVEIQAQVDLRDVVV